MKEFNFSSWVKDISLILIVVTMVIKLYKTDLTMTVDFPTLLSLLLAFFSVG